MSATKFKSRKEAMMGLRQSILASSQTKATADMGEAAIKYLAGYEPSEKERAAELAAAVAKDEKAERMSKTPQQRRKAKKSKKK